MGRLHGLAPAERALACAGLALLAAGLVLVLGTTPHARPSSSHRVSAPAEASITGRARTLEQLAAAELPAQMRRDARLLRHDHETRAQALRWFASSRLGIFVHYGPSSALAAPSDAAWLQDVHTRGYDAVVRRFRPNVRAAAADWVRLAKAAGASYLTVTVKHHDGFDLWHSGLTRWSVPADRDLLAALAPACRRAHLRLFLYYSILDLHEPTYRRDPAAYLAFVRGQLRELLTGYGPIAGVWFDGTWDHGLADAQLESLYRLVHRLQPWALVATNHHHAPLPGEDFQIFEAHFPGLPGPAWADSPVSKLPHQAAIALGPTWFWDGSDVPRSPARLVRLVREAAATQTSLLADFPPRPDGTIGGDVLATVRHARRLLASEARG